MHKIFSGKFTFGALNLQFIVTLARHICVYVCIYIYMCFLSKFRTEFESMG